MEPSETWWSRAEDVFSAAAALPEPARTAFVESECAGRPEMRSEVLRLLAAQAAMGSEFLAAPALDFAGQTFGQWRAVREVGRGGMSVVYAGQRADGGFEKNVAIKVVLLQVQQKANGPFQQHETRILAGLEHANIARLLDAGTASSGFPYLVMEFVEGQPIARYCQRLPEADRLRLFAGVCNAVQYAHRSLVVHRDLKPDNILVTAEGVPKLLDFGIAKMLTAGDGTGAATAGIRAFTPDYASPEQILGRPVTTSSDVYSLGVLLCELVGGRVPRAMAKLDMGALVDAAKDAEVSSVPLEGDLAAIAHKAMRRDPAERYESAGALARDVERYLAGLPVDARPPSWTYWTGKFIRRHKYAVAGAAAAALAVAGSIGLALWQARLARTRFEQVRRLSNSVLFELHDAVKNLPGSLEARQLLVKRGLEYLAILAQDTGATENVQLDVARGYLRMSDIQGKDSGGANVGNVAGALESARAAAGIARRVRKEDPENTAAAEILAEALEYAATAQLLRRENDAALELARESLTVAEQLAGMAPDKRTHQVRLAMALKQLAAVYDAKRAYRESLPLHHRSLELRKRIHEAEPADLSALQRYGEAHHWLSRAYFLAGDLADAERHGREAYRLSRQRAAIGENRRWALPNVAGDLSQLAGIAGRQKKFNEAVPLYREMLEIRQELLSLEPNSTLAVLRVASAQDRLGNTLTDAGRPAEALPLLDDALSRARTVLSKDRENGYAAREVVLALQDLAKAHDRMGSTGKACAAAAEAKAMLAGPWKKLASEVESPASAQLEARLRCR